MPVDDQDILRSYLQKVMELSENRQSSPTDDELRAIAREVGISEADLAAAAKSAEDHRTRGLGFLEHGRFDDAITELREASALAPGRIEIQEALANAYAGRYRRLGRHEDRQKAEALARSCLERDPGHQASFEILNQLDRRSAPAAGVEGRRSRLLIVSAVSGLLVLGGLVLYQTAPEPAFKARPEDGPTLQDGPALQVPAAAESEAAEVVASSSLDPPADEPPDAVAAELDLPAELETDLDLGWDLRLSRLNNYVTGKSFYKLNAVLENRGDTELEKVSGRLEMRGDAGQLVRQQSVDLIKDSAPPIRPGDLHAVKYLYEVVPEMQRAVLIVERVDQTPAAASYAAAQEIAIQWQEPQPAGIEISVRERSSRYSESAFSSGGGFFDVVLEVENTGSRSIRSLKFKAFIPGQDGAGQDGGGQDGAGSTEIERHVVTTSGPDLRVGGTRLVRFLKQVEARPAGYEVSVTGIR